MRAPRLIISLVILATGIPAAGIPAAGADLIATEQTPDFSGAIFYHVSTDDASLSLIGEITFDIPAGVGALEFTPDGVLIGVTPFEAYAIDLETLSATFVFSPHVTTWPTGGLTFFPDGLGLISQSFTQVGGFGLWYFDPADGEVFKVVETSDIDLGALAVRSDGVPVGIESETNALYTIDIDSEVISPFATLAPELGIVQGITALGGTTYLTTLPTDDAPGGLYTVDLFTGETDFIGAFDSDVRILGLAAPAPSTLAPLALGVLGLRARRRSSPAPRGPRPRARVPCPLS